MKTKKVKTRTVKMIDVQEWDKVVIKTYGRIYSLQQQDGCQSRGVLEITVPDETADDYENDSVPEDVNGPHMGVSFKAWLARDPKQPIKGQEYDFELEIWWRRNFYPDLLTVANDLHARGILEKGTYTINIDW